MTLRLADTNAWHRSGHPDVVDRWTEELLRDRIAITEPVRLELLYSARSGRDYDEVARDWMRFPSSLASDPRCCGRLTCSDRSPRPGPFTIGWR